MLNAKLTPAANFEGLYLINQVLHMQLVSCKLLNYRHFASVLSYQLSQRVKIFI